MINIVTVVFRPFVEVRNSCMQSSLKGQPHWFYEINSLLPDAMLFEAPHPLSVVELDSG